MNEILVSVNVNDTQATELAVNLANYFQNEVNGGSVLHALNKSTIKVTVTKFAVTREKESGKCDQMLFGVDYSANLSLRLLHYIILSKSWL